VVAGDAEIKFGQDHNIHGILVVVYLFFWGLCGLKTQEAPHVNKDSSPVAVCFLFIDMIQLLVAAETNKYCNQYLDTLDNDNRCSRLPDMIVEEMYVFLALIIQMRQNDNRLLIHSWTVQHTILQQHDEMQLILQKQ
jgi:hypothetical protein